MNEAPRRTFALITVPMLAALASERLYNQLVDPEAKVFVEGFHVHHLFFGIAAALPAAFVLAFPVRRPAARGAALVALGAGAGLILDEFVAMIATDMSTRAYLGPLSLGGACALAALASAFLLALAFAARG